MPNLDSDSLKHSRKRARTEEQKPKSGLRYKDDYADNGHKKHKRKHDKREKLDKHDKKEHVNIIDEDDDEVWIEKNIDGEVVVAQDIPTAESLKLTSRAYELETDAPIPPSNIIETQLKRDDWMLEHTSRPIVPNDKESSESDFFSSMGTQHKRKEAPKRPDPDAPVKHVGLWDPNNPEEKTERTTPAKARQSTPGGPGSQWRMMKLRKVFETATEEKRPIEEVALERFDSLSSFEEAKEERKILDEREGRRAPRGLKHDGSQGSKLQFEEQYMFTDVGAAAVVGRSASFRRPGARDRLESGPSTPVGRGSLPPTNKRLDSLRLPSEAASPATSHATLTPIPTVMTPPVAGPSKIPVLSMSELNKLQAKVLKAKLMGNSDAAQLEKEYEAELARAHNGGGATENEKGQKVQIEVLPTLDAQGRLYDVGQGKNDQSVLPGNRKKKEKVETRDPKTGQIVRYNADDDSTTLGDMLRQEKFSAGMSDQKNMDAQLAKAIMSDGKFEADLEYMDDNAEKLGRKKMRSDAMKRQFAVHDYARTKRILDTCPHCYGEDDSPPKVGVIAMATRCYLAATTHEELVEGHCHIVPIQHHLSMLEGDDDLWDEVRNFMKCLMKMFAEEDKGVIFYETVLNLKHQKHTYIECVPVPWEIYELLPAYFKESILQSEAEWSQHKKLIDFSARPGGFRRAMVPNLPYFMVQWDHKGEKGYGHVIEGTDEAAGGDPEGIIDEGAKGGGEFPRYFAAEIIGNQMDLEPRRWRRPRRTDFGANKTRVKAFNVRYAKYDWTGMISRS